LEKSKDFLVNKITLGEVRKEHNLTSPEIEALINSIGCTYCYCFPREIDCIHGVFLGKLILSRSLEGIMILPWEKKTEPKIPTDIWPKTRVFTKCNDIVDIEQLVTKLLYQYDEKDICTCFEHWLNREDRKSDISALLRIQRKYDKDNAKILKSEEFFRLLLKCVIDTCFVDKKECKKSLALIRSVIIKIPTAVSDSLDKTSSILSNLKPVYEILRAENLPDPVIAKLLMDKFSHKTEIGKRFFLDNAPDDKIPNDTTLRRKVDTLLNRASTYSIERVK
jgi:hypothetical protein